MIKLIWTTCLSTVLAEVKVAGRSCVISQSGFSGEAGYEIYLREATKFADDMWNAVLDAGKKT